MSLKDAFLRRLKKLKKISFLLFAIPIVAFVITACSSAAPANPDPATTPDELPGTPNELPETPGEPVETDEGELGFEGHPFSIIPPADAHLNGTWSPVMSWPLGAIHSVLLPNGNVLTYGTDARGRNGEGFIYDVWDPDDGFSLESHTTLPVTTQSNIFCSAQIVLPGSSQVLITGGTQNTPDEANFGINDVNTFNFLNNNLGRSPLAMLRGRWYPTTTLLANGEVLVHGGYDELKNPVLIPEVYTPEVGWRLLTGASSAELYDDGRWWYPRSFAAPNGLVFLLSKDNKKIWYLNTKGEGSLTEIGALDGLSITDEASVVMFERGKLLAIQGNQDASIIDISGTTLQTSQTASLKEVRIWSDATILPNGEVLVTGGSSEYQSLENAVNYAETWNPETGLWREGASAAKARLYHSSSLLLSNGTVLVAGGGPPGPIANLNAELYYPDYLFDEAGFAQRPIILSAALPGYNQTFKLSFTQAETISRVTLLGLGSVTHSFDMGQRFLELDFQQTGQTLNVTAPQDAATAPPGYYLIFILNDQGVPSEGQIISLGAEQPLILNPLGDERFTQAEAITKKIYASGQNLRYSSPDLPAGLSMDAETGLITGMPAETGQYKITVSVTNGVTTREDSAIWTIEEAGRNCSVLRQEAEQGQLSGHFVIASDSSARQSHYIHTPAGSGFFAQPNEDHKTDICLIAPNSGSYRIKAAVHAPSESNNSFFVRVNNSESYLWDISVTDTFSATYIQERSASSPLELNLNQGENTISIYQREEDVRLDYLELESLNSSDDSCAGLLQEAESGQLFGNFQSFTNAEASGGLYIAVPEGTGNNFMGPGNDKASYCMFTPGAGNYQLKAWTRAETNSDDSFFITVNNAPQEGYLWYVPGSSTFTEHYVTQSSGERIEVELEAGKNIITFHLREDNTQLDKLELVKVE